MPTVIEQREANLERASQFKVAMADRRRTLDALGYREGLHLAAEQLLNPPDETVARMRIGRFLRAIRGVERAKAQKFIRRAGLGDSVWEHRVAYEGASRGSRALTERQRRELARVLMLTASEATCR